MIDIMMNFRKMAIVVLFFILSQPVLVDCNGIFAQGASAIKVTITDESGKKVWSYANSTTLYVTCVNPQKNISQTAKDSFTLNVMSEVESTGELMLMSETTENSGIFTGTMKFRESPMPFASNNTLEAARGDRITARLLLSTDENGVETTAEDQAYFRGPKWSFQNTGSSHIILIPPFASITIDDKPIESGDFISVFYEKKTGDKTELINGGGMGREEAPGGVRYQGQVTSIAVWGAQENKQNGFRTGEEFKWKIWRASDGKVFDAEATYMTDQHGPHFSHRGEFAVDGISGILTLTAKTKK
jgi:hypothetical protein